MDRRTALITAGRTRLRPILMTTSAMVFGMLPLFLAIGEGAEMRAPMARAVVGGLITSTVLTLIVVPVVYTILDDFSGWLFGRKRRAARAAAAAVALVLGIGLGVAPVAEAQEGTRGAIAAQAAQAARAVEPAQQAPVRVLTLEEALATAAVQNRDIKKAVEYQRWVEGKYLEERASAMPQGSFNVNYLRTYDDSQSKLFRNFVPGGGTGDGGSSADIGEIFGGRQDIRSGAFQVSQVVFTWGQVGAAIRAAKLGFTLADSQLERFRQAVVKDVSTAFYNVLTAREAVSIAEQDLAQKQRHLDETTKRQSAGTATDYDVLAAQVAVDNAKPDVIRAKNLVFNTREQLRLLLAETDREVDVKGALETSIEPPPSYEALLAQALQNRPELREVDSTKGIYGELVTIAKAGNKPRVDFTANWGKRSLALRTLESNGTSWNAALLASIPLFDGWRTKGRVAQAKSDLMRLTLDELQLRDSIGVQVRVSLDALKEATEILTATAETVKQAERLLFLSEKGFELGVKTRLEVQDAELNVQSARLNMARARREYRVAKVNLDWVAGTSSLGPATPLPTTK